MKPHVLLTLDLQTVLPDPSGQRDTPELDLTDLLDAAGIDPDTLRPATNAAPAASAAAADGVDGRPSAARPPPRPRAPRLRWTGPLDPATARNLLREAAVAAVTTMGPWRAVGVGRTVRTLPPWLRPLLDPVHRRCRGPDCDRPIPWTEAHHQHTWTDLGDTDVNQTIPLCKKHHDLVTTGGWHARFDPDTGIVTWTSRDGTVHHTRPPPR